MTPYTRYRDYSQFQSDNPDTDLNGSDFDTDFDRIKAALDSLLDGVEDVRRDDGELANEIVGADQLKAELVAILGDWNPRGSWVTATAYAARDIVRDSNKVYVCLVAHTSGTFATDLAAEKWMLIGPATSGANVSNTPAGSILSTTVQNAINELDTNKQNKQALLTALSNLVTVSADKIIYSTGTDTFSTASITSYMRTLLAQANVADLALISGLLDKAGGTLTGALILAADPAVALGAATKQYVDNILGTVSAPNVPGGRLTLETAVPVSVSNQNAKTVIFYTPFTAGVLPLYDGAAWQARTFTELTLNLDNNAGHSGYHQTGKQFDCFIFDDSGTLRLGTGPSWTGTTTRSAAISRKDGRWTNSASITLRYNNGAINTAVVAANRALYVGTFITTADGQTYDALTDRMVWNTYNRVPRAMQALDVTDSWAYSTAAFRQANANADNSLNFIRGLDEDGVMATAMGVVNSSGATVRACNVGIGLDSSTVASGTRGNVPATNAGALNVVATYSGFPGLGYHELRWLEYGGGADTQTWYGDNGGAALQSGISGWVMA